MLGHDSPKDDSPGSKMQELRERALAWDMPILRTFRDDYGVHCIKIRTPRGPVYCITKKYPYKEMASFPSRVVYRAADHDSPVAVFFGEPRMGNAYVFDSAVVAAEGVPNRENTEPSRRKEWLDISLENGVIFGDWITHRRELISEKK